MPVVHSLRWIWSRSGVALFYVAEIERLEATRTPRAWLEGRPELKRDPLLLAEHLSLEQPGIAALLRQAREAFPHGWFDMGAHNWLARRDGTLVLTDPLSYRAKAGPTTHIEI